MSENPVRDAIQDAIKDHEVILFMKGTPERPMCGFSARTAAALEALGEQRADLGDLQLRVMLAGLVDEVVDDPLQRAALPALARARRPGRATSRPAPR